ncbi:DIP1984 family protein [Aequorivita xiaoshiensis]|uniref:DIP1984 family protein n=1 Tax=Aequorivita xiaoshiensis TaxID=2874476 RepID=A0A9X1R365_9FLAO|nr:DIP1984 family protein [Aequorivita xiaoshiensis]MCG2430942.1 DIP1984 family protein [Aequorivita xiaoshiensis]
MSDNNDRINKKMKLAEGLLLRADLLKKIEHLQNRIRPVLVVSDDKLPQEDPDKLIAQLRNAIQDLETLVIRINKTNNETLVEGEGVLMEALAKRDSLKMLSERLRRIRLDAQFNNSGDSNLKNTISIKKLQKEMDETGRAFRKIDSKIQEINWLTELKD